MEDFRIKYRPKQLSEFWGNNFIKRTWLGMIQKRRFPKSIILHGNYGTGKTSLARMLGRDLIEHGEDDLMLSREEQLIEINSPECDFTKVCNYSNRYKDIVHGTIVLFFDEAQRIQDKAQNGLLKPIEDANDLYFIFATTNLDAIDEGIKSRSTLFSIKKPSSEVIAEGLRKIADMEGIRITDDAIKLLIKRSKYSPRECLGNLYLFASHEGVIDVDDINEAL